LEFIALMAFQRKTTPTIQVIIIDIFVLIHPQSPHLVLIQNPGCESIGKTEKIHNDILIFDRYFQYIKTEIRLRPSDPASQ